MKSKNGNVEAAIETEILERLRPIEASDPWCLESFLKDLSNLDCLKARAHEADEGCAWASELVDKAIERLISKELVVGRFDPRFGDRKLALASAIEAPEYKAEGNAYERLKTAVLAAISAKGLQVRWTETRGWEVMDGQKVVASGGMRVLAAEFGLEVD